MNYSIYKNFFEWNIKAPRQKHLYHIVYPSPWPYYGGLAALLLTFGSAMYFHSYAWGSLLALVGLGLVLAIMFVWWRDIVRESTWLGYHTKVVQNGLRVGIALFILSEIMFFLCFFWAFFHSSLAPTYQIGSTWPPIGIIPLNPFKVPLLNTLILLWSGFILTWGHHSLIIGKNTLNKYLGLILTIFLAIEFTLYQLQEYMEAVFSISDGIYGSTFYMATGFHGFHVIIGTIFLIICFIRMILGHFTKNHHVGYTCAIWYWHFVDGVWLFLYITIYCWGSGLQY
jgi:cytochrome c oxidase subunit 3